MNKTVDNPANVNITWTWNRMNIYQKNNNKKKIKMLKNCYGHKFFNFIFRNTISIDQVLNLVWPDNTMNFTGKIYTNLTKFSIVRERWVNI